MMVGGSNCVTFTLNLLLSTLIRIWLSMAKSSPFITDISRRRLLHRTRPSKSVRASHTVTGGALMVMVSTTCVMTWSLPPLDFQINHDDS